MSNAVLIILLSLFLIGAGGVSLLFRSHWIAILISLEVIMNAAALLLVGLWVLNGMPTPDVAIIFLVILVLAASEVALGLGLGFQLYRKNESLSSGDWADPENDEVLPQPKELKLS